MSRKGQFMDQKVKRWLWLRVRHRNKSDCKHEWAVPSLLFCGAENQAYFSYFPDANMPWQKATQKQKGYFSLQFSGTIHQCGNGMTVGIWRSWSHCIPNQEAKNDERSCSAGFLLHAWSTFQAQKMAPPTFMMSFSISINLINIIFTGVPRRLSPTGSWSIKLTILAITGPQ